MFQTYNVLRINNLILHKRFNPDVKIMCHGGSLIVFFSVHCFKDKQISHKRFNPDVKCMCHGGSLVVTTEWVCMRKNDNAAYSTKLHLHGDPVKSTISA